MLSRIHCLYPQALVILLVIATLRHLQAQRRQHRAQRLGTMLWVYLFAIVLELSYSACLLGNVACDPLTWYVTCTLLAALALVVLRRDDLIDKTLRSMVTSEDELARARAGHRTTSVAAVAGASVATVAACVLARVLLGVSLSPAELAPLVAAGIALPVVFVLLSRGNGLASALASMAVVAVGVVQAHMAAAGQDFSVMRDMGALFSSFLRGETPLALTRAALVPIVLCGVAVALCSVLFRLPTVVDTPGEEEAPQEDEVPQDDADPRQLPDAEQDVTEEAPADEAPATDEAAPQDEESVG